MRCLRFSFFFIFGALLFSCSDKVNDVLISGKSLPMDATQEVPPKQLAANGTLDVVYNKSTRTLSYTFSWNSLTGNAIASHIHGTAMRGVSAPILQDFGAAFPKVQAGTFSGSVFIDGVVFKEEDLLAGRYYINIHTAQNPGGEIRAQIEFK